jgi:hypothetical protein
VVAATAATAITVQAAPKKNLILFIVTLAFLHQKAIKTFLKEYAYSFLQVFGFPCFGPFFRRQVDCCNNKLL